jgi:hypothetical protein
LGVFQESSLIRKSPLPLFSNSRLDGAAKEGLFSSLWKPTVGALSKGGQEGFYKSIFCYFEPVNIIGPARIE